MYRLHRVTAAGISLALVVALTLTSTSALQHAAHSEATVVGTPVSIGEIVVEGERPTLHQEDILWIARAIYSETKRPKEQELVAWVVRNRFETEYRGCDSYREVVLDPYQFSAFNPNTRSRAHYASLPWTSKQPGFQTAIALAARVAAADPSERPFSQMTRHFFSRRSMPGDQVPPWADRVEPVAVDPGIEPDRFRFFEMVS